MIRIKNLTVKNFLSVGNATQAVNFDREDLTLVLGENLDLGGNGSRNGTGKTTILNALSYALFGSAVSNIRKDNLINQTNGKHMLVSLDFEIDGTEYKIERGRKPNVLRFFVNNTEQKFEDTAQGDSRETQAYIEHLLGMSHDMFKHVVALNTYTDPFLNLRTNDQRQIIEQLLGITLLSEKAALVKEQAKQTKDKYQSEEYRIKAVQEANKRVQEQIESLKRRQSLWDKKKEEDIAQLTEAIENLSHVDIEAELQTHLDLKEWSKKKSTLATIESELTRLENDRKKTDSGIEKLVVEIEDIKNHKCYACGQEFHDEKHKEVLSTKEKQLTEQSAHFEDVVTRIDELVTERSVLGELSEKPTVFYDSLDDAYNHKGSLELLQQNLAGKVNDVNPYTEQISEMEKQAIQEVDYAHLNELNRLLEHQEFLLKLLTNKDSFIRKKIIEQNLSYLNARLSHYLDKIGLPHTVVFQNDLSVMITDLGRELDFDNLSRGERGRLIVSLSFAFRDVWESLFSKINLLFVDELFDNGFDTMGVESAMSLLKKMSRESNKSIWLVSHRDELMSRCDNILQVVKENGFTTFAENE